MLNNLVSLLQVGIDEGTVELNSFIGECYPMAHPSHDPHLPVNRRAISADIARALYYVGHWQERISRFCQLPAAAAAAATAIQMTEHRSLEQGINNRLYWRFPRPTRTPAPAPAPAIVAYTPQVKSPWSALVSVLANHADEAKSQIATELRQIVIGHGMSADLDWCEHDPRLLIAGKQQIKVSKLIAPFCGGYQSTIKDLTEKLQFQSPYAATAVKFVLDRDFSETYDPSRGCAFSSCMMSHSYHARSWAVDGVSPALAYDYSDGQAWSARLYSRSTGRLLARAIVSSASMAWCRIYGDSRSSRLLSDHLDAAGYRYDDRALDGLRIKRIELDGGDLYVPYLDGGIQTLADRGNHLEITDHDPDYKATETSGIAEPIGAICPDCGGAIHDHELDECIHTDDGAICPLCAEAYQWVDTIEAYRPEHETVWCHFQEITALADEATEIGDTGIYYTDDITRRDLGV